MSLYNLNPYVRNDEKVDNDLLLKCNLPGEWIDWCISRPDFPPPSEYFWMKDGFFKALPFMTKGMLNDIREKTGGGFHSLSLIQQAEIMNVPYGKYSPSEMCATYPVLVGSLEKRVEEFVLDYYISEGWEGDALEGSAFMFIIGVIGESLRSRGVLFHLSWEPAYAHIYPNGLVHKTSLEEQDESIISDVLDGVNDELFNVKFDEFCKKKRLLYSVSNAGRLSVENVKFAWRVLSKKTWKILSELHVLGYGTFGWPDLTLFKDGKIRFVEVKQGSDKYTDRQPYWWRNIGRPAAFDVSVMHINPSLKSVAKG